MIHVRQMISSDLPTLSEYWYDQMVLYQQTNQAIRFLPDARVRWEEAMAPLIAASDSIALTCEVQSEIVGGMIGQICENDPGLAPEQYGYLRYFLIDLHTSHRHKRLAHTLLQNFVERLRNAGLESVLMTVPAAALVEQGFWRGTAAKKVGDLFWMAL